MRTNQTCENQERAFQTKVMASARALKQEHTGHVSSTEKGQDGSAKAEMAGGSWRGRPDHTGYNGLCQELKFYSKGHAKSFDETVYDKSLIKCLAYRKLPINVSPLPTGE